MKIEKLTDNKIRIIINFDELSENDVDLISLSQNSEKAHSLFKIILDEAEKQVGFKVNDCKLLIEAFSSSDGYVIFTLTKYKRENTSNQQKKLKFKRKKPNNLLQNAIYKFDSFETFCNFCTYFKNLDSFNFNGFAKNISLYQYNDSYFLVLTQINKESKMNTQFFTIISEFSNVISNSSLFRSQLLEYGNIIFKNNAITNCIKYFITT